MSEMNVDRDVVVEAARRLYASDEIQIDYDAGVSYVDGGVWVQAWLWVPAEELPTEFPFDDLEEEEEEE